MHFIARFLIGGFLIASLPLVANRFGNRLAGLLAVLPITIGTGLVVLLQARGVPATKTAALSALYILPATATFLVVVIALLDHTSPVLSLVAGLTAWFAVAGIIYVLAH